MPHRPPWHEIILQSLLLALLLATLLLALGGTVLHWQVGP